MKPYNFDQSPKVRLEYYRRKATEANARVKPNEAGTNWKHCRYYGKPAFLKTGSISRSEDGEKLFFDSLNDWPCSSYQDAHDVAKLDHTGWYADSFQDNLIRGAVVAFRKPHKINDEFEDDNYYYADEFKSHVFYYPATYSTEWDMATVYLDEYTDIKDCARRADQLAECEAEEAREYDAKDQAEQQIDDAKRELHELNRETLQVIRELKQNSTVDLFEGKAALCRVIREHIEDVMEKRAELFEKIAKLKDDPWSAVSGY